MQKYSRLLFYILVALGNATAFAGLPESFKTSMKDYKGPFGLNYLQGSEERKEIVENVVAPKNFLFQAAYRDDKARAMVAEFDFYVANLFTTNYYELMGEYVYNDAFGNHNIDHKALYEKRSAALNKMTSMVRHWVLEKYYIEQFETSRLAGAFRIRGISGAEFEQKYAIYFFNLYLSSLSEDFQYLPAYLLSQRSPIGSSNALDKARRDIDVIYQKYVQPDPTSETIIKDNLSDRLYLIRNSIHNQLTPTVITMIDQFIKDFPQYQDNATLGQIKNTLVGFYSSGADKIAELAKKLKFVEVQKAAETITKSGANAQQLLQLSTAVANLRTQLTVAESTIAYDAKAETLLLITKCSQYLAKELSALVKIEDLKIFQVAIDAVYMEGFLIKDNWEYFKSELAGTTELASAQSQLADVLSIGQETLDTAFKPSLDQWISVEGKMQNFRDNTIKASALNLLSLLAQKK